jgi:hypothetical protein
MKTSVFMIVTVFNCYSIKVRPMHDKMQNFYSA